GQRVIVPDAHDVIAESPQGQLRAIDESERLTIDPRAVREPRRKAGRSCLLRARNPQRSGESAHLLLADARLEEWVPDTVLGRGGEPWAPVADIVGVRAREQRRKPAARSKCAQPLVELRLAVVAAVAAIGDVALSLQLVRRDHLVRDADSPCD